MSLKQHRILIPPLYCCYSHNYISVTASIVLSSLHRWKWGGPTGRMLISLSIQMLTLWTLQITALKGMTAYQTDIPDPACSEETMSLWLSRHGLVLFSEKTLQFSLNLSPNLNSPVNTPKQGNLKPSAGVATNEPPDCSAKCYQSR